MEKREAYLTLRIPRPLLKKIEAQMHAERRGNRSEMVRVLLEDGLKHRRQQGG
jgi:Arc/MetJ-type ribon-helix-helix transcriptional regulator